MRCAYGLCNSDSRYKHKDYMKGVFFILFPKPSENLLKCKVWVNACGRKDFSVANVKLHTYICNKHFIGENGPTKENPNPIPLSQANVIRKTRRAWQNRTEAKHLNIDEEIDDRRRAIDIQQQECFPIPSTSAASELDQRECFPIQPTSVAFEHNYSSDQPITSKVDRGVQTVGEYYMRQLFDHIEHKRTSSEESYCSLFFKIYFCVLSRDEEQFQYFCGLTVKNFEVLYEMLGPAIMSDLKKPGEVSKKFKKRATLSNKDKLLLCLIRYRRGFTLKELSYFFSISVSMVSNIVYVWTQFMYFQFLKYKSVMFVSRNDQKENKPACFRPFKNLRVVLDCTEIFIQMPKNFQEQGNTYSNYKHKNTVKFLVGISANGAIIYISEAFEGAISDRELFKKSDIFDYLEPGDVVLADRGFDIQDLLNVKKVKLIIPPFLRGRDKLTTEEETLTKQIARSRIHVERLIQRIKSYRILSNVMPNKVLPIISQIFYNICCLVNFEKSTVVT